MKCPYCATLENKVIDSRLSSGGEVTRRRRECEACGRRYTTYERVEQHVPTVVKQDGRRQPFDRDKLLQGLRRAAVKRPIDEERLEATVTRVEQRLSEAGEHEIQARQIGALVLEELKRLDTVAYVRFASVYRQFATLEEFVAELNVLQENDAFPGTLPDALSRPLDHAGARADGEAPDADGRGRASNEDGP